MYKRFLLCSVFFITCLTASAQINRLGLSGGIGYGGLLRRYGITGQTSPFPGERYLRYGFADPLQIEVGAGIGENRGLGLSNLALPG